MFVALHGLRPVYATLLVTVHVMGSGKSSGPRLRVCTITKDMSFLTCDFPCEKSALQSKESAPQGRWFAKFAVRDSAKRTPCDCTCAQHAWLCGVDVGLHGWMLWELGCCGCLWLFCAVFASYFGGCLLWC